MTTTVSHRLGVCVVTLSISDGGSTFLVEEDEGITNMTTSTITGILSVLPFIFPEKTDKVFTYTASEPCKDGF